MTAHLLTRLRTFNADRLPEKVARKYRAMSASPFAFFRGTAHLFYTEALAASPLSSAPLTWLCGDLHLENFGTHKGENRLTYFDISDFDDGALGPCTWDVVRFLTSLYLAGVGLNYAEEDLRHVADFCLESYYAALARGKILSLERAAATGLVKKLIKTLKKRPRREFLDQRTHLVKKERRFILQEGRYEALPAQEAAQITQTLQQLGESLGAADFYRVLDVAFRVAGTGSLGLRRYAILVEGRGSPDENFILDLKETRISALAPILTAPQPAWLNQAQRIASIQARCQAVSPALLTPVEVAGDWFLLRELQPSQDKISLVGGKIRPVLFKQLAGDMAAIVAWNQLRSGGRGASAIADELIAFGERAALKTELLRTAQSQMRQALADYQVFCEAFGAGKLK